MLSSRFTDPDLVNGETEELGDILNGKFTALKTVADMAYINRGDYDDEADYRANDVVKLAGVKWAAKRDVLGVEPVAGDDWELFSGTGSGVSSWDDLTDKPVTVAESGIADAATTTALAAEATTRGTADTALQQDIDGHIAETDPHSGAVPRDGSRALTGDINFGSFKGTNAAPGVNPTDLATMAQLDAVANGYIDLTNAKAMSTTNVVLSGAQTIDNVSCVADDIVFLAGQTTQSQNGPWLVKAGAWDRPADFDTGDTPVAGTRIFVVNGTTYHGTSWTLLTSGAVIDTNALTWTQTGAAGTGEANTTSNAGTEGVGVALTKSGVNFPFANLVSMSNLLTIAFNGGTNALRFTINAGNFLLQDLGGVLTSVKGGTGFSTYNVGDIIVGAASNALAKITRNTSTTHKYLKQYGDGIGGVTTEFGTIAAADLPVMGASGVLHAPGAVPDPGATASSEEYLCRDATWRRPSGGGYKAASTTSRTLSIGSKVLTIAAGLAYTPGVRVRISYQTDTTQFMEGVCTAYNATTGQITVLTDLIEGAGTYALWNLNITGEPGAPGDDGDPGQDGADGIFSAIASQAEAQAGTNNTKGMTPLRTAEAIAALGGTGGSNHAADLYLFNNVI